MGALDLSPLVRELVIGKPEYSVALDPAYRRGTLREAWISDQWAMPQKVTCLMVDDWKFHAFDFFLIRENSPAVFMQKGGDSLQFPQANFAFDTQHLFIYKGIGFQWRLVEMGNAVASLSSAIGVSMWPAMENITQALNALNFHIETEAEIASRVAKGKRVGETPIKKWGFDVPD